MTNLWEMLLHRFVLLSKIRGVTFLCPAGRDAALNILKELFLETHLNPILFLLVKFMFFCTSHSSGLCLLFASFFQNYITWESN